MADTGLQKGAHWATILGAIVTTISVVVASLTFVEASEYQRETASVGVLQEYLKLAVEHPELASRPESVPVDSAYDWFASHAFFTAETLWDMTGDEEDWRRAVDAIIREHRAYVTQGAFPCEDYGRAFVEYLRTRIPQLRCSTDSAGT